MGSWNNAWTDWGAWDDRSWNDWWNSGWAKGKVKGKGGKGKAKAQEVLTCVAPGCDGWSLAFAGAKH